MKIQFYGKLAEILGRDIEVDVDEDCSIAELRQRLSMAHPHAAPSLGSRTRACVDDTFVNESHVVRPSDRVEFLPIVSGG